MTTPIAELTGVSYGYDRRSLVLDGFTASFEPGAVYAITGASGCGKSTVLSLAGLLLKPRSGRIGVMGEDLTRAHDAERARVRRRSIGFIFQDALLETSMTVWRNISEALPPNAATRSARQAADEMLELLELPADIGRRRAITLSGGQSQRIGVVRALLKQPALVLADEPTGNLDDRTARIVLDALFSYARQPGRACVIVTHDERIAGEADHVLRLAVSG
jgi:ABC-type lipoprotein export system ATPase subunit